MTTELKPPLYDAEKTEPSVFCVTGATGFVAGPIVQRLLAAGHTVHGTARKLEGPAVDQLRALPGAADRLKLFKGDLLEEGSFDEAVKGARYVLHTASPFTMSVPAKKVQEVLLNPAVKGTENVLGSCSRSPSVERVVLTSSVFAVVCDPTERGEGHVYDHNDWNITGSATVMPYSYSKKLAEEKAWEMAKAQGSWTMATINPGFVMGPPLGTHTGSESIGFMRDMCSGKFPAVPDSGFGVCDVRDVAAAHVLAAVNPKAEGRYIVVSKSVSMLGMADLVREAYPSGLKLPTWTAPTWLLRLVGPLLGLSSDFIKTSVGKPVVQYDSSRAVRDLVLRYTPAEETVGDMVQVLMQQGVVKPSLPRAPAKGGSKEDQG